MTLASLEGQSRPERYNSLEEFLSLSEGVISQITAHELNYIKHIKIVGPILTT